jgi:hypothetical protein
MLPLLILLSVSANSGSGGFLSGFLNFFNSFFPAQPDPPQLVSTSGSVFDLPNSNIVEVPPNLPSIEMPTNQFTNIFNPSINNFLQNSIFGNSGFNLPNIPQIP